MTFAIDRANPLYRPRERRDREVERFFTKGRCPACHMVPETWLVGEERWNASQFIECTLCHAEFDALLTTPALRQIHQIIGGMPGRGIFGKRP